MRGCLNGYCNERQQNQTIELPPYLRDRIPSPDRLIECFVNEPFNVDGGAQFFRAAYVPKSVLPHRVQRVYRFGPTPELIGSGGQMLFWSLYTAHDAETAIWEAQFCKNDVMRPGTFYFDDFAVQHGVIAELQFPLRLWNLNGSISNRLGIYDDLCGPDYDWCQWFGYFMDVAMQSCDEATTRTEVFVYPSPRHELKQIDLNALILRTSEMQAAAVGKLPSTEIILAPKLPIVYRRH
jgi:hypothetical protein